MSMGTPETDAILMNFAQRAGNLDVLLTSFFGFLHRKTDLYIEQEGQSFSMGFKKGEAEKKVLQAFHRFPMKRGDSIRLKGGGSHGGMPKGEQSDGSRKKKPAGAPKLVEVEQVSAPEAQSPPFNADASLPPASGEPSSTATTSSVPSKAEVVPAIRLTEDGKQIPIGNGGVTDRYHWTQTLHEVTVYIAVPPGTRGKDILFKIKPRHLQLELRGEKRDSTSENNTDILTGDLGGTVRHHEAVWTLEDRKTVILTLEKAVETWWSCVVKGDAQIDTTKVDSTRNVSDYDPVTQGHIRKIMYDQRQKALGLPTSDEEKTNDILERAKNLPGSPFSQEYLASAVGQPGSGGPQLDA